MFRNEIMWTSSKYVVINQPVNQAYKYRKYDAMILYCFMHKAVFYREYKFHKLYVPLTQSYIDDTFTKKDENGRGGIIDTIIELGKSEVTLGLNTKVN